MRHINSFKINEAVMFFFITMIISIPKNDIHIRNIPYTPDALRKNTLRPPSTTEFCKTPGRKIEKHVASSQDHTSPPKSDKPKSLNKNETLPSTDSIMLIERIHSIKTNRFFTGICPFQTLSVFLQKHPDRTHEREYPCQTENTRRICQV